MHSLEPGDEFGRFRVRPDQYGQRLDRVLPLSALREGSLNDQAMRVAELVDSTFRLLKENHP